MPDHLKGQTVLGVAAIYVGDVNAGERADNLFRLNQNAVPSRLVGEPAFA